MASEHSFDVTGVATYRRVMDRCSRKGQAKCNKISETGL